jgi:hypothetical protein
MEVDNMVVKQKFAQVHGIITLHRSRALQAVNSENLLTTWEVGAFVSARFKNFVWGSKTVMQPSEYLRTQYPTLRGYSRRTISNNMKDFTLKRGKSITIKHETIKTK